MNEVHFKGHLFYLFFPPPCLFYEWLESRFCPPPFAAQLFGRLLCSDFFYLSENQFPCYNHLMESRRHLPIGLQDFKNVRTRNCVYVDKTRFVYEMANDNHPYFLSRPRRFGKSLLLSTMYYYFLGQKELFEGLALGELEKDWVEYPVFRISFGGGGFEDDAHLKKYLNRVLSEFEKKYEISISDYDIENYSGRLETLMNVAQEKTGKQVVVLIDEYDKPILDAVYSEYEEKNRSILRDFYSPLKDNEDSLRFLFITGITKVSNVNIFSGLNQLDDISLTNKYSTICGISETELEEYFQPEIACLASEQKMTVEEAKQKLAKIYDGYHFSPESEGVYNPFCLLKCLNDSDFGSYWFESGTPSFLVKTLQNQPLQLQSILNGRKATEEQFKNYDPESKNMLPVIYQSGYLTIKDFQKERRIYTLGFPNEEIEKGFLNAVLKKFVKVPDDDLGLAIDNLCIALTENNIDRALRIIQAAIADLPTVIQKNMCENYYESVTHVMFRMTGFDVVSELQNQYGRSDVIVTLPNAVYIFELKMDKGRAFEEVAEEGLAQIDEKGYSDRFAVSGKAMHKIALVFSSEGKGLLGWKVK